jgi:hypothetical protein
MLVLAVLAAGLSACSGPFGQAAPPAGALTAANLPGLQVWNHGASSLLFGTNDTYEYGGNNLETQPIFQQKLRSAGFTVIRTFIKDQSSDSEIEQRVQTIEHIGAHCLVVITNIDDLTFNEHLVRYLGSRCLMYEFGNEPDYNNISVDAYARAWNSAIPALRRLNPSARFFGPVFAYDHTDYLRAYLTQVKSAGNLPDAVSFHWYACYNDPQDACLAKAGSVYDAVLDVRASIQAALGKTLPIAVTEWNFDPNAPPPAYGDDAGFEARFMPAVVSALVKAQVVLSCEYDAASFAGWGGLDMFDVHTNQPKPQYYELAKQIAVYRPAG